VQSDDPRVTAEHWSMAYGRPIIKKRGVPTLVLGSSEVRFVPLIDERGPGLRSIDVIAIDIANVLDNADRLKLPRQGNAIDVCGITINVVENGCIS
jgi:hypothetical protein